MNLPIIRYQVIDLIEFYIRCVFGACFFYAFAWRSGKCQLA